MIRAAGKRVSMRPFMVATNGPWWPKSVVMVITPQAENLPGPCDSLTCPSIPLRSAHRPIVDCAPMSIAGSPENTSNQASTTPNQDGPGLWTLLGVGACFALSGFAALLYQTAWTRQFSL